MLFELRDNSFYGENFIFEAVFVEGRKLKSWEDYRVVLRGEKTGKLYMILIHRKYEHQPNFPMRYELSIFDNFTVKTPKHYKCGRTNFYYVDNDPNKLEDILTKWRKADPNVHINGFYHTFISLHPNYQYTYKFNNKSY